jgi:hypothetical protein
MKKDPSREQYHASRMQTLRGNSFSKVSDWTVTAREEKVFGIGTIVLVRALDDVMIPVPSGMYVIRSCCTYPRRLAHARMRALPCPEKPALELFREGPYQSSQIVCAITGEVNGPNYATIRVSTRS